MPFGVSLHMVSNLTPFDGDLFNPKRLWKGVFAKKRFL
jgi:hypothetical protein